MNLEITNSCKQEIVDPKLEDSNKIRNPENTQEQIQNLIKEDLETSGSSKIFPTSNSKVANLTKILSPLLN